MKITNDRAAFFGKLGETIDIYQAEHAAAAAYRTLGGYSASTGKKCTVVVGHDASASADMMNAAVSAALSASGANVIQLGTVPSGAVSGAVEAADAIMGVMITGGCFDSDVSGLKFYDSQGQQITGERLQSIHDVTDSVQELRCKQPGSILSAAPALAGLYRANLNDASGFAIFEDLRVAVDCLGSATAPFAADVLKQLGVEAVMRKPSDDGTAFRPSYENPSELLHLVRDTESDIGFGFSADGEACIVALPDGKLLDSERLAAIFGRVYGSAFHNEGEQPVIMLSDSCHVALGSYIKSMGADCRTITGDYSYLAEEFAGYDNVIMAADRYSGVIFPRRLKVPDGLMTAVMLLSSMNRMGMTLAEMSADIPRLIRSLSSVNIPSGAYIPVLNTTDLEDEIFVLRSYLSGDGRVLMYRSDNRVQIIVEGIKSNQVNKVIEDAENLVRKNLRRQDGKPIYSQPSFGQNEQKPADYEDEIDDYVNIKKGS